MIATKENYRKMLLKKRNTLSSKKIQEKSSRIINKLYSLNIMKNSNVIHCYISIDKEVYTHNFILNESKRKTILIPSIKGNKIVSSKFLNFNNLKKNSFGIPEPIKLPKVNKKMIDIAIIPGIGFDKYGSRIGYGKGYYDFFLKNLNCYKIGFAYDFQIVEKIPKEKHDILMDYIISDKRIIQCNKNGD